MRTLRYTNSHGFIDRVFNPDAAAVASAVALMPPGSIFVTSGSQPISRLIGWFSVLRHPMMILRHGWRTPYSHCGLIVGSPAGKTVEALPRGVVNGNLTQNISNSQDLVVVWSNSGMNSERAGMLERAIENELGRPYDYLIDLSFALPLGQDPAGMNCVEVVLDACKAAGVLPRALDAENNTPFDLQVWLDSREGRDMGWRRTLTWV